jgi:hypothetical protein
VQVGFHSCLAVATVSGHCAGWPAGAAGDAGDGRRQLWGVGRVSGFDGVVDDDAVGVVDDLGLVAELGGVAEPAAADRAGVAVVRADQAARSVSQ